MNRRNFIKKSSFAACACVSVSALSFLQSCEDNTAYDQNTDNDGDNDIQLSVNDKLKNVDLRLISLNIVNEYFYESKYEDVRFILQNIILSPNDANDINVRYINALYDFNNNVKNVKI